MSEQRYTREMHQEYRRREDEKARQAEADRRERSAKDAARLKWVADGGDERAFERNWPSIRDEQLKARVKDTDAEARNAQHGMGVSTI